MARFGVIMRWIGFNALFLLASFVLVGVLVALFPDQMLALFGSWAVLLSALGAKTASELPSLPQVFWHIVQRNVLAALIYFAIGLLVQAPLALLFGGAFYALIAFLAPVTIGRPFAIHDWLLITVESAALLIAASLASALAAEVYQVKPSLGSVGRYWIKSWTTFSTKTVRPWKEVLTAWGWSLAVGALVVIGLVFFVAWFETYGY